MNQLALTIIVITIVYFFIFTNRRIRTSSAFLGGIAVILLGLISFEKAIDYVDFNKIGIVIGVMVFTTIAKDSGIFQFLAIKVMRYSKGNPWLLLVLLSILTGALSSFFDEITTVLFMANITIAITSILNISSIPFLVSQIIFANIGGMATYLGTPANIMIGSAAHFSFFDFIYHTTPIAIILTIINIYYFKFIFSKDLSETRVPQPVLSRLQKIDDKESIIDHALYKKVVIMIIIGVILIFFSHGLEIDLAAIILFLAIMLLFISPGKSAHSIYSQIDWGIVFFLIGLNILAGTMEEHGIIDILSKKIVELTRADFQYLDFLFLTSSTFLSSFLDNIPIVNLAIPIIDHIVQEFPSTAPVIWITIVLGANIGANGTLIGTASNLIVAEIAEKNNQRIYFWYFFKIAFPLVIIDLCIASIYFYLRYLL
jgi:Na+/H+ antiporter NhaD/arsenite permease-like protein